MHPDYPLPDVDDPVMRPFWDGAREGRLMLQRVGGDARDPLGIAVDEQQAEAQDVLIRR